MKILWTMLAAFVAFVQCVHAQRRWGPSGCDDATPAVAGRVVSSRLAEGWYKEKDGWQSYYEKGQLISKVHMASKKYRGADGKEAEWPWCDCGNPKCECKKGECTCDEKKKCADGCSCGKPVAEDLPIGYNGGLDISGLGDRNSPSFQGDDKPLSVPDYSSKPYITVFAKDGSTAKKIAGEIRNDVDLSKVYNVSGYASDHFHASGFRLQDDQEFAKSGLAIYVQDPVDSKGLGGVRKKINDYKDVKDFAKRIDPNFDPNKKPPDPKNPVVRKAGFPLPLVAAIIGILWFMKRKRAHDGLESN